MAYGVKYRLIFSDVNGNGKKVEILKKDYTGEVFPLIGGANPVQISWQSSEDFYKPIIGSKCTLSLMVTDDVQYDDFYKFDEREYKVVVYYAKSQGEILTERIIEDGGTVESAECVTAQNEGFGTITDFYENRVLLDGGGVESLSCVSNVITDETYYEFAPYWSGFLVVDRYIEKLISKPYGVTFNAYDGLGTLNNFNAPIREDYDGTNLTTAYYKDAERIALILENLGLDLDVHYINDIVADKIRSGSPDLLFFPQFRSIEPGTTEQVKGYDVPKAKDQLTLLLSTYNMRIFQSFNKWYVVEATNVFDKYVKDMIFNEVSVTGVPPTGIRNKISNQLNDTKKEFLKVYKYGTDGIYDETYIDEVLFEAPTKLRPIKNDLSVEYLQGINRIITESKNANLTQGGFNCGFEYGDSGYNLTNSEAFISDTIVFQGEKSVGVTYTDPFDRPSPTAVQELFYVNDVRIDPVADNTLLSEEIKRFKLSFQYYLHMDTTEDEGIENYIGFDVRVRSLGGDFKYYDYKNNRWEINPPDNYVTQTDFNKWRKVEFEITNENLIGGLFAEDTIVDLRIIINGVNVEEAYKLQYLGLYYDNVILTYDDNKSTDEKTATSTLQNGRFLTTDKTQNRLYQESINNYKRSRDSYGTPSTNNLLKDNYTIQNQNIANDFREFVSRYSGRFRVDNIIPFSMHNKIWFNWQNSESDLQSSIVDGLTYDLKDAEIRIKAHLPNDDDDVLIETITR